MSTVKWLHLSDLHLNTPGFGNSFLRDELPKFLIRKGIVCDYVFCTGDLRDARQGEFPEDNGQFLKDICDAVGAKDLFIVPGNHDVDRGDGQLEKGSLIRHKTVQKIYFSGKGYYRPEAGIIEPDDLRVLNEKQEGFRNYISKILPAERMALYKDPMRPHFNIETEYLNILHVDSTLVYTIEQENNNLIVGLNLLYEAIKTINKNKPTILLTHFAYTMLAQEERKYVRELLFRNGIQLWLAGHEHEHNLQPINYLHSLQSGELRLEDKCNTSVLVGELDTQSGVGSVKAYAWFKEGWYQYPAIWHGTGRDDVYPFVLKFQENGELRSFEALNSHKYNSRFKRITSLLDFLYADVECNGKVYKGREGINNCLCDLWEKSENLILIADGGMGKTTRLLSATDYLSHKVAVYIPLESTKPENLIRDICRAVFEDSDEKRLYQFAKNRHTTPDIYLFLDGMNEVVIEREKDFVNVIRTITRDYPGIQVVITSRSDFTERYCFEGFVIGRLNPLRLEQIKLLFTESEWQNIQTNPPLMKLIKNPMMATLYKQIYPEMGMKKEYLNWIEDIMNETELLYDYYLSQIALCLSKWEEDQIVYVAQYICNCLPYIAYEFEHNARHTMPIVEFRNLLDTASEITDDDMVETIKRKLRIRFVKTITGFDLEDYLFNVSHLMYESDGNVSFPHQIHRDYLSAVWLTKTPNLMECWNERVFTAAVSGHISALSKGRYWEHIAESIIDCARGREDCKNLIVNVINAFPYTEESGTPDFTELDFRGIRIPDYPYLGNKIKLAGTKIDDFSIGCESGDTILMKGMSFSENNSYLAGITDDELIIYSMETGSKVFRSAIYTNQERIGKAVTKFSADARYLFIKKKQDLIVFANRDKTWIRVGEFNEVFEKRLHNAIIHDEEITFYYTNRVKTFSLLTGKIINNTGTRHPYENVIDGEDIAKMALISSQKTEEEFSTALSKDGKYRAICFQDGRIVVKYNGGKVLHNLESGRGILKTAAISKDGNRAVTMSANIYNGKRRLQLWDLDTRTRVEERFCSGKTESIYLTDHGDWIIGTENNVSWMWNWEDSEKQLCRGEKFISETDGGLSMYGNSLLFQSGDGNLKELNLDDNSIRLIGKYDPIKYATVIPQNRIAIVSRSEKYVEFESVRDGRLFCLNSEMYNIKSVHAFQNQPFIAVVTTNGMMSVYHVEEGKRKRKLTPSRKYKMIAYHPVDNVVSFSDGRQHIETFRYFEWMKNGQKRGNWYGPSCPKFKIQGNIIAIGFNTVQKEQIMIETNGTITFMNDRFCDFHSQTKVITNFSVNGYDFTGVICNEEIMEQIVRNGGELREGPV